MSDFESKLPGGVFAASVTPLNEDFSIDYHAMVKHAWWLLAHGNDGICFMGTTGEANSFSVEERTVALDQLIEGGIPSHQLLVGTGCSALTDTIQLTRHAVSKNVGGVLMLPPFYYKGLKDDDLFKYFSIVIERVANKDLKIYLYHFPKMTGVPFSISILERLVNAYPNTVVGMKDSGGDWNNMAAVCDAIPGFKLYSGTEKYFLDVLRAGGAGVISATTNVTGELASDVYKHWKDNQADELQSKLTDARLAFEGTSFISSVKHVLAKWHNNKNWLYVRPPNGNLNSQQIADLEHKLEQIHLTAPFDA